MIFHSDKSLYGYIADYCNEFYPECYYTCLELLKLDALISNRGVRPDILNWNGNLWSKEKDAFWKNEVLVRKYIPEFRFTSWRDIKRKYHVEVFTPGVLKAFTHVNNYTGYVAVVFSYIDGLTEFKVIDDADFWI